jgi:hypothetical protein
MKIERKRDRGRLFDILEKEQMKRDRKKCIMMMKKYLV